jgi:ParB family chromosome partitioning protein
MEVNIELVQPSPYQPRLIFDQGGLKEEIKKDGLLNALVVRKQGKFYELIDGERRLRTLKDLGWKKVPVQVVKADDAKTRLTVYKLNKIRENYTVEEESRYFKKLADEGVTPLEISKHIKALERVINRNIKEAVLFANQILERKLTVSETRKIAKKRAWELRARVDDMRIKAAEEVLPAIASQVPKLETPEEFERAAEALKQKAREIRKGLATPDEIRNEAGRLKEKVEEVSIQARPQTITSLRGKIEELEKEREVLLAKKGFLTEALSFNCPHCNNACIVYREGESYWVE